MTPARAAIFLALVLCVAYGGDAGHGLIKDDFRWIRETRLEGWSDLPRLLSRSDGFYRPLVSASFALNTHTTGMRARAYGWTNLLLALTAAALVGLLARRLGLGDAAALLAAGVWVFNAHGINMAVLWISGRTSLLVTIASLLSAVAAAAGRPWLAAAGCCAALLAKEEAVLLPAILGAWYFYDAEGGARQRLAIAARRVLPCVAALALYLGLRSTTDAFWPGDAPAYYRLSFSPSVLAANIVQYADRALTASAFVAVILFAATKGRARLDSVEKRVALFGGMWLAGCHALTLFVPARSSLYTVLPSVGAALAAAAVASACRRVAPARTRLALIALTILPALLIPVYWRRNERWVRLADLSASVLHDVRDVAAGEAGRPIVLVDSALERFNLEGAFGSLWPDAAALFLEPGTDATIGSKAAAPRDAILLRLENGRLSRQP